MNESKIETINLAIKRNKERFPDDFYFRLTSDEYNKLLETSSLVEKVNIFDMRFQIETVSKRNKRYLPYVLTEHGVAMLSSVLKTKLAIEVSVNIMRVFIEMRRFIINNAKFLSTVVGDNNEIRL